MVLVSEVLKIRQAHSKAKHASLGEHWTKRGILDFLPFRDNANIQLHSLMLNNDTAQLYQKYTKDILTTKSFLPIV